MSLLESLMDSFSVIKIDDIGQFFAVGERFPFAIFIENRHTPEIFTLNPIATICLWKLICGNGINHINCLFFYSLTKTLTL